MIAKMRERQPIGLMISQAHLPAILDGPQLRFQDRKWRVDTVAEYVLWQGTDSVRARLGINCNDDAEVIDFIQEHSGALWCVQTVDQLPTEEEFLRRQEQGLVRTDTGLLLAGDSILIAYKARDGAELERAKHDAGYKGKTRSGQPKSMYIRERDVREEIVKQ